MIEGGVLVHCRHGASRSPTVVAAHLLATHLHTEAQNALAFVKERRPQTSPNNGFIAQLEQYAASLSKSANETAKS